MDLSKWVKGLEILVSHVNVQKVTSMEKLNNQVDKMIHFVDSQPLSQPNLLLPNGHINKVLGVACGGDALA